MRNRLCAGTAAVTLWKSGARGAKVIKFWSGGTEAESELQNTEKVARKKLEILELESVKKFIWFLKSGTHKL